MDLLYFKIASGNFGDDLNDWLWDGLIPGWRDWAPETVLVGLGTVLKQGFVPDDRRKLVLGSGYGYGAAPKDIADTDMWDIRAVRGPKTAKVLGLPAELAIADPAVMVPLLQGFDDIERGEEVLFVPHHSSDGFINWNAVCEGAGATYLSPSGDAREVIARLASARLVIAESMHAAILADAFGVPWRAVSVSRNFSHFKWQDWGESLQIDPQFTPFFPLLKLGRKLGAPARKGQVASMQPAHAPGHAAGAGFRTHGIKRRLLEADARRTMRALVRSGKGQLSDRSVLSHQRDRFRSMLDGVVRDYAG